MRAKGGRRLLTWDRSRGGRLDLEKGGDLGLREVRVFLY